jgi:hypothetical protein
MIMGFLKLFSEKLSRVESFLKAIGYEGEPYGYAFGLSAKGNRAPDGLEPGGRCYPRGIDPADL